MGKVKKNNEKQAVAELCQAQVQLEVAVDFAVEVEACHYQPGWVVVGGWTKTKLMLISSQVEVVVEVEVELGNY